MKPKTLPCYIITENESKNKLSYIKPDLTHDDEKVISVLGKPLEGYYPVYGFDFLYINKYGNVYSLITKGPLKTYTERSGYVTIMTKDGMGNTVSQRLHRLMLLAFRPIKDADKYVVNHIDGNKSNNHIENLEWVTTLQNNVHFNEELRPSYLCPTAGKKEHGIAVKDLRTNEVMNFKTYKEVADFFKTHSTTIRRRLRSNPAIIWEDCFQMMYKCDLDELGGWPTPSRKTVPTSNRKLHFRWLDTGETLEYINVIDACKLTGINSSGLSQILNTKVARPFLSKLGRPFQAKWQFSNHEWLDTSDMIEIYDKANELKPICVLIDKDDNYHVFHGLIDVTKFTDKNKTAVNYRFKICRDYFWDNKYRYYYYKDYKARFGLIPEDKLILHFELK